MRERELNFEFFGVVGVRGGELSGGASGLGLRKDEAEGGEYLHDILSHGEDRCYDDVYNRPRNKLQLYGWPRYPRRRTELAGPRRQIER